MTPHNYLRQAIPAIKEIIHRLDATPGFISKSLELLEEAQKAVKFVLPDNGVIFDNQLRGLPDILKLPYNEIVIEYFCSNSGGRSVDNFGENQTTPVRKRIVYAQQEGDNIVVASIVCFETSVGDRWQVLPYVAELIPRSKISDSEILDNAELNDEEYLKKYPETHKVDKVVGTYYDLGGMAKKCHGDDWQEHAYHNMGDECQTVLSLIEALSCSNVKATPLPARQKMNKGAAKRGALPFDEYHILTLDGHSKSSGEGKTFLDRRSPREHLRRGHIRRLENKRIWINSMVVNAGNHGKIHKSYMLEAA